MNRCPTCTGRLLGTKLGEALDEPGMVVKEGGEIGDLAGGGHLLRTGEGA